MLKYYKKYKKCKKYKTRIKYIKTSSKSGYEAKTYKNKKKNKGWMDLLMLYNVI